MNRRDAKMQSRKEKKGEKMKMKRGVVVTKVDNQ